MNKQLNKLSIYIRPLISHKENQTYTDLKFLYENSDKKYEETDNPEQADIILIALPGNDMPFNTFVKSFLKLKLSPKHLDKTFAVSLRRDKHIFLMRGVYESAGKYGMGKSSRIKSGAFSEKAFNSLIEHLPIHNGKALLQEKTYLYSFIGRNCHSVREAIYKLKPKRADVLIEDSSDFNLWSKTKSRNYHERLTYYTNVIQSSKFSLCPRGYGASSIRLFESMKMGVCPVIISDEWKLPVGPNWNNCSIMVNENQVKDIEEIISKREEEYLELGINAVNTYKRYFSKKNHFNWIVETCLDILESQKIPERFWWKLRYFHYILFVSFSGLKKNLRLCKRILKSIIKASNT